MGKRELKPTVALEPVPVAMVTCADNQGHANVITLAWVGVACSVPPMLTIAVRPERFSRKMLQETREFVVNVPSTDLAWAVDYCGTRSGRNEDKFAAAGLTPAPATRVKAPLIAECPINMECVVRHELSLGTHDLLIGEIVAVHADESVLDDKGRIAADKVKPLAYTIGDYWSLGPRVAAHSFSLKSPRPGS
jgi:flavin reductase (DIM6/NTAB) family NADH-FMN oxidoreductase RutF